MQVKKVKEEIITDEKITEEKIMEEKISQEKIQEEKVTEKKVKEEKEKDKKIKVAGKIIGWLLCIIFLVTCSIGFVSEAKKISPTNEDWTSHIIQQMIDPINYVLYYQAMLEKNPMLDSTSDVFFPEEVNTEPFYAGSWEAMLAHYSNLLYGCDNIEYLVIDNENRQTLYESDQSDLISEFFIQSDNSADGQAQWTQKMQEKFGYYTVIQYDENGKATVLDCFGVDRNNILATKQPLNEKSEFEVPIYEKVDSEIATLIENSLESGSFILDNEIYYLRGPHEDKIDRIYEYVNSSGDKSYTTLLYKHTGYINPSGIKDVTIVVAISEPMQIGNTMFYMDSDYYSIPNGFAFLLIGFLIVTIIAAIVISCIKLLGIATGFISKIPLELIALFVAATIHQVHPLARLTQSFTSGLLAQEMVNARITESIANTLDDIIIHGVWFVFFGVIFFSIVSVLSVFRKGIKRYCFENILVIRIITYLLKLGKKMIKLGKGMIKRILTFDLHDSVNRTVLKVVLLNFIIIFIMCCFWFLGIPILIVYSILVFYFLRKYLNSLKENYDKVIEAAHNMAEGQLDYQIDEKLGLFTPLASELNKVQEGFKQAVLEEVKSQKMKTELITNVSHDLKTPLTAIITYVNLLKDEDITKEQQEEYIEVLDNKAMRLKQLIEDLFEVSKINSSNITLNPVDVDVVELIKQAQLELLERFEEAHIDYRLTVPEDKVILHLDSQKTYRIFENLFVNVVKYALPNTRAYMSVTKEDGIVTIEMKNVSAQELNISPEQLTERFVRGDKSRNTEGSGLGLAIVKSIVEVQGGTFSIEVDGDLFKVIIQFHQ